MKIPSLVCIVALATATACGGADDSFPGLPIADAGFDVDGLTGELITLDGTASSEPEGRTLSYSWAFAVRPEASRAVLLDSSFADPSFVPDLEGTYLLTLVVNGGVRKSEADIVAVHALHRDIPAVASCFNVPRNADQGGPEQDHCVVVHGRLAKLNGGRILTPDIAYSYIWTQVTENCPAVCAEGNPAFADCTPSSTPVTLVNSSSDGRLVNFLAPESKNEELVFRLEVSDGFAVRSQCVAYTTTNAAPQILSVTTSGAANGRINEGASFTLSASIGDADDDELTLRWSQTTGEPAADISDDGRATTQVRAPAVNVTQQLRFTLTVSDGVDEASEDVVLTVVNGI